MSSTSSTSTSTPAASKKRVWHVNEEGDPWTTPLELTPRQLQLFEGALEDITQKKQHHIILYDGVCLVCNKTVNFVQDHDPEGLFHFAPLQSEFAAYLVRLKEIPPMDSMILIEGGHPNKTAPWYCRSTAALRIGAQLQPSWFFSLAWLLLLIPSIIRDAGYKAFANCRYRLFGRIDESSGEGTCRDITKENRGRFLEYVIKDMEKEWNRLAKEAATTAPPVTPFGVLDPASAANIRQETDRELCERHGHSHPIRSAQPIDTTDALHGTGGEFQLTNQEKLSSTLGQRKTASVVTE